VPHLEFDFRCEIVFNRPIHPPLGNIKVLSQSQALNLGLNCLERTMSTSEDVSLELLLLDGSNYASWSASVLDVFRAMGPQIEQIVDVSISPPSDDFDYLSREEVKCLQYNAQLLISYLVL
jgi:hypothetical protein